MRCQAIKATIFGGSCSDGHMYIRLQTVFTMWINQTINYTNSDSFFYSKIPLTKMRWQPIYMTGLLAWSSLITALPTANSADSVASEEPNSSPNVLVDQTTFDLMSFYSQLAAASYCSSNINGGSSIVTCSGPVNNNTNNCPMVQDRMLRTMLKFPT
jgi:hypothetical protein